jgi:ankyrin repeat protein
VVERLLSAGADAKARSKTGRTALHVISKDGHLSVVEVLLSSGRCGDLEARDEHGVTALHLASQRGHASVVERLICAGADPYVPTIAGSTLLDLDLPPAMTRLVAELKALGPARYRANRIWLRRSQVTLWRVAFNYA